ncbi:hypothetical protein Acsp04_63150 [Actinomadura sp. NBRC 104425]|nr:hypothetical protein Acsp04_63150 [Actinomadura sp. NBRC 104425]
MRATATAHGGTVAAEPREGGGLVVTVRLPARGEKGAPPDAARVPAGRDGRL